MQTSYLDSLSLEAYASMIEKTAGLFEACQIHSLPVDRRSLCGPCGLPASGCRDLELGKALAPILLPSGSLLAPDALISHVLAPRILIHRLGCHTSRQLRESFGLSWETAVKTMDDYRRWFSFISRTTRRPLPQEQRLEALFFPSSPVSLPAPSRTVPAKRPSPASKRRIREMDLRASFFRELGEIYGEERLFCMLEEQWTCGSAV